MAKRLVFKPPASLPISTHPMYVYAHRAALQSIMKFADKHAAAVAARVCLEVWAKDKEGRYLNPDDHVDYLQQVDAFIGLIYDDAWKAANPE